MYEVPFVPTPEVVLRRMLQLAGVRPGEVVYDLGCGDGRILISAARDFKAYAVGVEIRQDLYKQCVEKVRDLGLEDRVTVIHGSFFDVDLSEADVITMYLLTSVNERLKPKLEKELTGGTRVVSHDFEVPGWRPVILEDLYEEWRSHKIYLYVVRKREVPVPTGKPVYVEDPLTSKVLGLIDGKRSLVDIAGELGVPNSAVKRAVKRLLKLGAVGDLVVE